MEKFMATYECSECGGGGVLNCRLLINLQMVF